MKIAATYKMLANRRQTKLLFVLFAVISTAFSQESASSKSETSSKPLEPEYINSFFLLDSTGSLKPLERQTAGHRGKVKALGFGGAEMSYTVDGDRSPVRTSAGAPLALVVKLENHDVDPGNLVELFTLKAAKGERELVIAKHHFMGSTKVDIQGQQVALQFSKYGQSSVKITTSAPLPPGEYAMGIKGQTGMPLAYCFGVDAATR
jgi:hypothetical protein